MARFNPTSRAPLWPPADARIWPNLPPLPELPPCPVVLGDCRVGDIVLLASGERAEILGVGSLGARLRPLATSTRVVEDSRTGETKTFHVRRPAYTVAGSARAQAVVEHIDAEAAA